VIVKESPDHATAKKQNRGLGWRFLKVYRLAISRL
jgi:hypothetical protein